MARKKDRAKDDALARKRAELIIKVRSGHMTATDAAAALGVSRKTYYEWEERALQGMLHALENGKPGRPPKKVEEHTERLKERVRRLEEELEAHQTALRVREVLDPVFPPKVDPEDVKGKTTAKKKPQ